MEDPCTPNKSVLPKDTTMQYVPPTAINIEIDFPRHDLMSELMNDEESGQLSTNTYMYHLLTNQHARCTLKEIRSFRSIPSIIEKSPLNELHVLIKMDFVGCIWV